jgi:uncharacterized membrane protein YfcA
MLDPRLVLLGFAALMVAAGVRMLRQQPEEGGDCALPGGGVNWRGCLPKSIAAGTVIIPALVLLLGLPMGIAIGTSLVVIVINSTAAFAAHADSIDLDYGVATTFAASAIIGSLVAGRLAARLPAERLRRPFAYLVLLIATLVTGQLIIAPSLITAAPG